MLSTFFSCNFRAIFFFTKIFCRDFSSWIIANYKFSFHKCKIPRKNKKPHKKKSPPNNNTIYYQILLQLSRYGQIQSVHTGSNQIQKVHNNFFFSKSLCSKLRQYHAAVGNRHSLLLEMGYPNSRRDVTGSESELFPRAIYYSSLFWINFKPLWPEFLWY